MQGSRVLGFQGSSEKRKKRVQGVKKSEGFEDSRVQVRKDKKGFEWVEGSSEKNS